MPLQPSPSPPQLLGHPRSASAPPRTPFSDLPPSYYSHDEIGDAGAGALAEGLRGLGSLKWLYLS